MFRFVVLLPTLSACSPYAGLRPLSSTSAAGADAADAGISYRVLTLAVDADTTDNHLPTALDALDVMLPDQGWGLDGFNATLADNVANWSAIFVEIHPGAPLHLHVNGGEVHPDGTVTVDQALAQPLEGAMIGDDGFSAGPGDVTLDFVVAEGLAPVPLALVDTRADGTYADTLAGTFQTVIPLDVVIEEIVAPAIPTEGYDLGGDGVPESPEVVLDFVWSLAPTIGDVTLPDGTPAITARLSFSGERAEPDTGEHHDETAPVGQ